MTTYPKTSDKHDQFDLRNEKLVKQVVDRFFTRHHIFFGTQIEKIIEVGEYMGEQVKFIPKDLDHFAEILQRRGFTEDGENGIVGCIAKGATKGRGFREPGVPSLHVALHPDECSVHIDTYGFVAIGPDGRAIYNLDAVQHIVDELFWQDKFVTWLGSKASWTLPVTRRLHPTVPTSRDNYRLALGAQFNLAEGPGWRIGVQTNIHISGEKRLMGNVEIFDW